MDDPPRPEGIEHQHLHEAKGSIVRRGPFGLMGLAAVLLPAFFGVYGGDVKRVGSGDNVHLIVEGPDRARNGEFFEMNIRIQASGGIGDLVVLIGADLLHQVTINTLLPDPSEHGFRNGSFEFRFGPLDAGENLQVKLDGQINPGHGPTANEDTIAVADGERVLTTVNYAMEVLP
jgi:hypothetical protein